MAYDLKLTAKQRVDFYMEALQCFKTRSEGPYVCNVLKCLCRDMYPELIRYPAFEGYANEFCELNFPEFYEQLNGEYSWPETEAGNLKRVAALEAAIALANKNA
jgi:hypothetical protein